MSVSHRQIESHDPISFYASAAGGRLAFNITTGIVTIASSGEQPLAALVNPTGSGKDIYLDLGEFGASANTTFRRYRASTLSNLASPISALNMSSGATASVAEMYIPPNFTRSGGSVAKTAHIAAYQQYLTQIKGRVILRPGNNIAWTITGPASGNFTASVFFEFFELPAL